MRKQDDLSEFRPGGSDAGPGAFDDLLREIEKEAVPERLLDLARQLQAALAERRRREDNEATPTEA